MPLLDDVDSEALISRLAAPLLPANRVAFRAAAEDVLAHVPCPGEGSVYRAVATLQRQFFDPPPDRKTGRPIGPNTTKPPGTGRDRRPAMAR
jgi:hypothetical protein